MQYPSSDARAHGIEALRKGDARKARESFERIVAAGQADAFPQKSSSLRPILAGLEFRDAVRRPSPEQGIEPEAVRNVACRVEAADLACRAMVHHASEKRT